MLDVFMVIGGVVLGTVFTVAVLYFIIELKNCSVDITKKK